MKYALMLFLIAFSSNAYAETTICNISGMFMFTKISWDSNSGEAKATDISNRTYGGKHVFTRNHNGGKAHTLRFVFKDKTAAGTDMTEFVIYPKDKESKQRVLGVAFRLNDNDRFVDFSYGSHDIQCLSDRK